MTLWRKSSFSSAYGNCVEVAWRKSSRSGINSNCVEVAPTALVAAVRDSKNPTGPVLTFPTPAWHHFIPRP